MCGRGKIREISAEIEGGRLIAVRSLIYKRSNSPSGHGVNARRICGAGGIYA